VLAREVHVRLGVGLGHTDLLPADTALHDVLRLLYTDDLAQLIADAGLSVSLVGEGVRRKSKRGKRGRKRLLSRDKCCEMRSMLCVSEE
jgi:UDP-N-acetylglucosamine transferase subunit ALG13